MVDAARIAEFLEKLREPLADYQEKRGLDKDEHYGFLNLASSMCDSAYQAILNIFAVLLNMVPLLEAFLFLARFALDSSIDICNTEDTSEKVFKTLVFLGELALITILSIIICGFIILPVTFLLMEIFGKMYTLTFVSSDSVPKP